MMISCGDPSNLYITDIWFLTLFSTHQLSNLNDFISSKYSQIAELLTLFQKRLV